MNPNHPAAKKLRNRVDRDEDGSSENSELTSDAEDIYSVATKHRDGVKAREAVLKKRKSASRGR
jgi:uncharacterized protein (UPF0335 family)